MWILTTVLRRRITRPVVLQPDWQASGCVLTIRLRRVETECSAEELFNLLLVLRLGEMHETAGTSVQNLFIKPCCQLQLNKRGRDPHNTGIFPYGVVFDYQLYKFEDQHMTMLHCSRAPPERIS
jgi:hypothetical protein